MKTPNIEDNPVYRALRVAENWLDDLYDGRINGMVLTGPPGIGKTRLAYTVAKRRGIPICAPRPGTARGLLQCLHDHAHVPIIVLDDLDSVTSGEMVLNTLKVALDSKSHRILSHIVGDGNNRHTIPPIELTARVLFISNKDFTDRDQFTRKIWDSGILPLKDRCTVIGLPFDPAALYDYVGWLATEGGTLRSLYFDFPDGQYIPTKDGTLAIAYKGNRRRFLSRAEQEEILTHFYNYAPRYPSLSPRELVRFATARIGKTFDFWAAQIAPLLTGNWELPAVRHRYTVMPPAPASEKGEARPPACCAPAPPTTPTCPARTSPELSAPPLPPTSGAVMPTDNNGPRPATVVTSREAHGAGGVAAAVSADQEEAGIPAASAPADHPEATAAGAAVPADDEPSVTRAAPPVDAAAAEPAGLGAKQPVKAGLVKQDQVPTRRIAPNYVPPQPGSRRAKHRGMRDCPHRGRDKSGCHHIPRCNAAGECLAIMSELDNVRHDARGAMSSPLSP
jgi:hypothetical protein